MNTASVWRRGIDDCEYRLHVAVWVTVNAVSVWMGGMCDHEYHLFVKGRYG